MDDGIRQTVPDDEREAELIARLGASRTKIFDEMHKAIVGQEHVLQHLFIALLCRGHCLLQGVPGLAKTLIIRTLGQVFDCSFSRIQFTPDLLPADITGTDIIQEDPESGRRQFEFLPGPLFSQLVLADEINRAPPKTQSALLEAMQESRVTVRGLSYELPDPFFVLATQNPIEQEGTYPLPEAQLDRFMFQLCMNYPSAEEEKEILRRTTQVQAPLIHKQFSADDLPVLQDLVRGVPVPDHLYDQVVALIHLTRENTDVFAWGAGPRAGQHLLLAAKARALLYGRFHVSVEDVRDLAIPVLRHRVVLSFAAQAAGESTDHQLAKMVDTVVTP